MVVSQREWFRLCAARTDRPRRGRHRVKTATLPTGPDGIDEICDVIRPEIENGAATVLEVRVPDASTPYHGSLTWRVPEVIRPTFTL